MTNSPRKTPYAQTLQKLGEDAIFTKIIEILNREQLQEAARISKELTEKSDTKIIRKTKEIKDQYEEYIKQIEALDDSGKKLQDVKAKLQKIGKSDLINIAYLSLRSSPNESPPLAAFIKVIIDELNQLKSSKITSMENKIKEKTQYKIEHLVKVTQDEYFNYALSIARRSIGLNDIRQYLVQQAIEELNEPSSLTSSKSSGSLSTIPSSPEQEKPPAPNGKDLLHFPGIPTLPNNPTNPLADRPATTTIDQHKKKNER